MKRAGLKFIFGISLKKRYAIRLVLVLKLLRFSSLSQMHIIPALVLSPESAIVMRFHVVDHASGLVVCSTGTSPAGAHLVLLEAPLALEGLCPGS